MSAWVTKHWRALLAAAAINFPSLWHGIKWLWDWAGRFDVVASHAHGIGGTVSFLMNPPPWTVFVTGLLGVLIVLWDVRRPNTLRNLTAIKNHMGLYLGLAIAFFVLGTGFAAAAYWQYRYPAPPPPPEESGLLKAARDDFRHSGGIAQATEVIERSPDSVVVPPLTISIWVRSDLIAMAKFLVFYVPRGFDSPPSPPLGGIRPPRQTYEALKKMADRYPGIIERLGSTGDAGIGDMGEDNMRYDSQAPFTGAIYIYHEGDLTEAERVELRALYLSRGARAFFRSWRHLKERQPPQATH